MSDVEVLRSAVISHGKRLDAHSERIRDVELAAAAGAARSQAIEAEFRRMNEDLCERLDAHTVQLASVVERLAGERVKVALLTTAAAIAGGALATWALR